MAAFDEASTGARPSLPASRDTALEILAVFVAALAAYFAISRYLLVAPETVVTLRNNVLFETDSGVRLRYLTDPGTWAASRLEFLQHPAFFLVWRPLGLGLTWLFGLVAGPAAAAVLAAQSLICVSAAAGAAALYAVARRWEAPKPVALLPVVLLVFCTSTVMVVVPEHWAMAQGMMLAAVWIAMLPGRPGRGGLWAVGGLCALIAGTTITNGVFALLLFGFVAMRAGLRVPSGRVLAGVGAAGLVGLVGAGWVATRLPHVAGFLNLRLVQDLPAALTYAAFGLVAPLVGPVPWSSIERQHLVLSYEPVSFAMYTAVQWIGVIAWCCLLAVCAWLALRDRDSRLAAAILATWVGFNLLFHNLWGDEFFLYSAHWAWALVAIVALGMRHVRNRLLVPLVAAVLVGQIASLLVIGGMLRGS